MKNVILRSPFTALRVDSGDEESRKCLILRTLIFFAEFTLSQMKRILRFAQDDRRGTQSSPPSLRTGQSARRNPGREQESIFREGFFPHATFHLEAVKKSKTSRRDAEAPKTRQEKLVCLLRALCDSSPPREAFFLPPELLHSFLPPTGLAMKTYVLDASALITFFEDRPGADQVEELLAKAAEAKHPLAMSVVNWGEVYYSVWRARGKSGAGEALRNRPASLCRC